MWSVKLIKKLFENDLIYPIIFKAITREEELQEKWAEGKQTKKMSRQKYGF
jgi:hypothetical protein